jgi:uncharacterized membrane-anchored protein
MNRVTKWFWAVVLAQAVFLLAWAGYHEFVRQHAPVILLKGRPVDPQDLLSGDYLTIGYDINFAPLPTKKTSSGSEIKMDRGDAWVLLEPRGGYHEVVAVSGERLQSGPGQVLVHGAFGYNTRGGGGTINVDYGIERYFVPEGKGSPRFKRMEVEASVSPSHRLYIKRVLLDGKAYP